MFKNLSSVVKLNYTSVVLYLLFIIPAIIFIQYYVINKYQQSMNETIKLNKKFVDKSINSIIQTKINSYIAKYERLFTRDDILNALENKDRQLFYNLTKKAYKEMSAGDKYLFGMHIILPDNLSFIRVHKPHVKDLHIKNGKKPLIDEVNKTKKISTGFGVGKFDYLFRINIPIFSKKNIYLGVVEFTIDFKYFSRYIKQYLHFDNVLLIQNIQNKEFLKMSQKTNNGYSIYQSTNKQLIQRLVNNYSSGSDILNINNKQFKVTSLPLNINSILLISFDISEIIEEEKKFKNNILFVLYISIILFSILWFFTTKHLIKLIKANNQKEKDLKFVNKELLQFNKTLGHKVKEKTNELQKSLDIISDEIIYSKTSLDGIVTEVSNAFCEISQYSRNELINRTHSMLRHPDTDEEIYKLMWNTIAHDHVWHGIVKNLKKDGSSYIVNMSITAQYDQNNKKIGYMAIMHNITSSIELEKLNHSLKTKVKEEVSKNIAKEMLLFEQSKMASIGAMIGNIAHQWKQPLSIISITTSNIRIQNDLGILDVEKLPEETRLIEKQIEHLSNTIDTFRNFLKERKEFKEVILQDRIDVALNISSVVLKDSGIDLRNNINYLTPVKVSLVIGELAEVLINIINNAKDILIEKEIQTPWVQLDLIQDENKVIITIEDNGGGIPENILPKIFDEYFTTKSEDMGTGLGLHMSHQIITQSLKGRLYAKNSENGAKFFIEFPLACK